MQIELDGHKTTGTHEAATPSLRRKAVGAKWMLTSQTDKDGLVVKTNTRLVAKGFSQAQDVGYFRTLALIPLSTSVKVLAAVANGHGLKIFSFGVTQSSLFARALTAKHIHETTRGVRWHVRKDRSPQPIVVWPKAKRTAVGRTIGRERGRERYGADPNVFRMVVDCKVHKNRRWPFM